MRAQEAGCRQVPDPVLVLIDQPAMLHVGIVVAPPDEGGRPDLRRLVEDRGFCRTTLVAHHDGHAELADTGLLARDLRQVVAEKFLVVEADRRDHAERRARDDIGGVIATAEPHFQDQPVGRVFGEEQQRGGGGDFEKGDRFAEIRGLAAREGLDQRVVVDRYGIDEDAFVEIDEVGRGVDVDGLALGAGHLGEIGAGRPLAVGAGHVDRRGQVVLGIAQRGQESLQAAERQVDLAGMQARQA